MNLETLPINSLSEDPANARRHPERNLEQIQASLRRFGQQKPIVIDSKNVVRAGNGMLSAARSLGWKTIQVVRSDLANLDLTAYAIVDNRSAELAEWDEDILRATLLEKDLGDVGFLNAEIEAMNAARAYDEKPPDELLVEKWLIVVTCEDEAHQADLLEKFGQQGLACKALVG